MRVKSRSSPPYIGENFEFLGRKVPLQNQTHLWVPFVQYFHYPTPLGLLGPLILYQMSICDELISKKEKEKEINVAEERCYSLSINIDKRWMDS